VEKLGPKHPDWKYLQQSNEQRMKDQSKPFDAKTDVWVKHDTEMYQMAKITAEKGDKVTVQTATGETLDLPAAEANPQNPPKFFQAEDMSDLSHLNDASVLYNLRSRYDVLMIYTYSGLFCIAINPYKLLPVYTQIARDFYVNKRRSEAPPHLYSIADGAYQNMRLERKHQSMLITGESGAGKTENTKRVLQFYALTAADPNAAKSAGDAKGGSLEDQIVQANPPLEAYGNAKTVRNNNSSRFGKFIRIHFGAKGKIAAADIETYLLEKSRVTFQLEIERNYHIFYQFLSPKYPDYQKMCLTDPEPSKYFFINQGKLTVDGMDDAFEMSATEEALDILGFTQDEKENCYKITCAVMWSGNAKFKQKGREEQGECDGQEEVEKVATLMGLDIEEYIETLLKPKLKVGKDYVRKGQNKDQILFSVAATAKSTYARLFDWIVEKVNKTLDTPNPREHFIGVLDIAGFEIFELNTLEQLLINYTNERLQQFFNHHMFVEEQEEYKREGIQWAFVDFGMDLVKTIELIEKKMGILSMLEEECIVPKATDDTYLEKMMNKHLGKHQSFGKPKPSKNKKAGVPDPHFEIHHYAGTVGYNVTGWLFKNKDPVNDAVIGMMASATNAVVSLVFTEKDDGTKKKGSSMMTISAAHRESLLKLMTNLHSTHPHFVRCIIPNEIKKSGHIDAPLVMHQLNCNGVLEGIRICMLGLPNKVPHADFMTRYSIVAPKIFADLAGQPQECAQKALVHAGMDEDSFRCGLTKIMFRAGMLSKLEEIRDAALSAIFIKMQCQSRRVLVHVLYQTKIAEKKALQSIQRNIKLYYNCRDWAWYQFYTMIKGEMEVLKKKKVEEERRKAMQEGFEKFQAMLAASVEARQAAEKESATKVALLSALKAEKEAMGSEAVEILAQIAEAEADIAKAEKKKADFIAKRDSDRIEMKKEIAANKKEADEKEAAARQGLEDGKKKTKHCFSVFGGTKKKALALEADVKAMKEEIKSLKLQISSDDKKGHQIMRAKKNLWLEVGDLQGSIATKLEKGKAWDSKFKLVMFEQVLGAE